MPSPELIAWITLSKEILLGLAALVAIVVGVYGIRAWKRDLVGKEVYIATKKLVKESHIISKAAVSLRDPTYRSEERHFTQEEVLHSTELERWSRNESKVYNLRIDKFIDIQENYSLAKLDLRILIGSKAYEKFLPFDRLIAESLNLVIFYLELIHDENYVSSPELPIIIDAQKAMYPSSNLDDELTANLHDAREEAEKSLLKYLHRNSIRGYRVLHKTY
ncbi:hypothetical protein [Psychrobacter sp. DAB_AL43B]|uniref:hypothetical protein n=1 Tax=Psychrobacter sp. DAB_AL43B TaxID=1028416 RepID=UPI0009A691BD|nr:hypothetical protein [Psychrobacter sp. DAB_AL43B]SLJ85909.1 hypothetical protein DABAL43B_2734 [Psychrobacter sp. DAB_AL43B]